MWINLQSWKKLLSSVSWIPRNIFKIANIIEHFKQVYLKSNNPTQILWCLRFLIGYKVSFLNYIRLNCLNVSLLSDFVVKNFTSKKIYIEKHYLGDAQDTRNILHFFRLWSLYGYTLSLYIYTLSLYRCILLLYICTLLLYRCTLSLYRYTLSLYICTLLLHRCTLSLNRCTIAVQMYAIAVQMYTIAVQMYIIAVQIHSIAVHMYSIAIQMYTVAVQKHTIAVQI